jgi:CrcB protein
MADGRAYALVALGAAAGGLCRYVIGLYFTSRYGADFPYGTFFINLTASFLIGVVAEFALSGAFGVGPLARLTLSVGFLGGYSTFSAFSIETLTLALAGHWARAVLYSLGSVVLGVGACWAGILLARAVERAV